MFLRSKKFYVRQVIWFMVMVMVMVMVMDNGRCVWVLVKLEERQLLGMELTRLDINIQFDDR